MASTIETVSFVSLLPSSISDDATIMAAAEALDAELKKVVRLIPVVAPLQNIDNMTEPALSHVAWQMSVDDWDAGWDVDVKRSMLKVALLLHRKKGTAWAVETALAARGYEALHVNWPEFGGQPFTFRVDVDVFDEPVTDAVRSGVAKSVGKNKALRSHLDKIIVASSIRGGALIAGSAQTGRVIDVYSWQPQGVETSGELALGAAAVTYRITNVGV